MSERQFRGGREGRVGRVIAVASLSAMTVAGIARAAELRPVGTMGAGLQRAGDAVGADDLLAPQDPQAATTCADGTTLPGIDVSKWQGSINWNSVAGAGIVYAIMRATHGINTIDEFFVENWAESRAAGIYGGVYQYFEPGQDAVEQANIMLEMMGPLGPEDLPPVIDVESHGNLPPAEVAAAVSQWITTVEAATGVKPIIYTGRYFWQDYVQSPAFADYPLWIAHYTTGCPNIPDQWDDWYFHQYTSSGSVAGISGDVDRNDFNGDLTALSGLFAAPAVCGDDKCTGDEDADVCPEDCTACGVVDALGGTIDDGDACYQLGGPQEYWRHETVGEGGDLAWTMATDYDTKSNFGRIELHFADAGTYRVEAHLVPEFAMSTRARYHITHAGGSDDMIIDQVAAASADDGWAQLGEFVFEAGGHDQAIELDDNTGDPPANEIKLVYDAVRLTRLDPPASDDTGATTDPTAGDSTDDGSPSDGTEGLPSGDSSGGFDSGDDSALPPGFADDEDAGGCGCRSDLDARASAWWLLLPIVWPRRRRVQRRRG